MDTLNKTSYIDTNFCGYYTPNGPTWTVNVNFHFLLKDDGTGNYNEIDDGKWPPDTSLNGYNIALSYIDFLNRRLNKHTNYQFTYDGNVIPISAFPVNVKARIYTNPINPSDKGVYFHRNTTLYNSIQLEPSRVGSVALDSFSVNGNKVIDVFFIEDTTEGASGVAYGNALQALFNAYHGNLRNTFVHEFAHNIGLAHTSVPLDTLGNCDQQDNCSDTPEDTCYYNIGNNVMNYGNQLEFFTPCQLGTIHNQLRRNSTAEVNGSDCEKTVTTRINSGTHIIWDETKYALGDIEIDSGAILSVQCLLFMPKDSRILVERGGKLIVDWGHIVSCSSEENWNGIEVEGSPSLQHTLNDSAIFSSNPYFNNPKFGVLILKRNTFIEGAKIAIRLCNSENDTLCGGILNMSQSNILADSICIYAAGFPNKNQTKIENSRLTLNPGTDTTSTYRAAIYMENVNKLEISNCIIRISIPWIIIPQEINPYIPLYGVKSINSSFLINNSSFSNFGFAICAFNFRPLKSRVSIVNNTFHFNFKDILLAGSEYPLIQNNSFRLQAYQYSASFLIGPVRYGLYLFGSNNYYLGDNIYTLSDFNQIYQNDSLSSALYIYNSGNSANESRGDIFNYGSQYDINNFKGLVADGNNIGLNIKCNSFTGDTIFNNIKYRGNIDIYGPIAELQGLCRTNASPANNSFADSCSGGNTHIWKNPSLPDVLYSYSQSTGFPLFNPEDTCIQSFSVFQERPCLTAGGTQYVDHCPTFGRIINGVPATTFPGVLAGIVSIRDSINDIYQRLDGSHTGGVINYINDAMVTEGNIWDTLRSLGPVLSDDVLLALMYRSPGVNTDSLAHYLLNNAPHSNLLMMSLADRSPALPVDSMNLLYQYQDSSSARKDRIDTLGYYLNELELAYNELLYYVYEDGDSTYTFAEVIDSLETEPAYFVNLQMKLADLYMIQEDYTAAEGIWNTVPQYYNETTQMVNLRGMQVDKLEVGETYEDFNGDELGLLDDIAASNTRAAIQAQVILSVTRGDTLREILHDRQTVSAKTGDWQQNKPAIEQHTNVPVIPQIKIYPNPASTVLNIEYDLGEYSNATFQLNSLVGMSVSQIPLNNSKGNISLDVTSLASGIYICNIFSNGIIIKQEKVVLIK